MSEVVFVGGSVSEGFVFLFIFCFSAVVLISAIHHSMFHLPMIPSFQVLYIHSLCFIHPIQSLFSQPINQLISYCTPIHLLSSFCIPIFSGAVECAVIIHLPRPTHPHPQKPETKK